MATKTELSVDIMRHIQKTLNNIIESTGEIQINNKIIWDGYLHQMDNEVWRGILETMNLLSKQHPELFTLYQLVAIGEGLAALDKYEDYYDKVLNMKTKVISHKGIAWKCFMTVREVMNKACNIDIPNSNVSRVTSNFADIFNG
jgi:hypothetical protein